VVAPASSVCFASSCCLLRDEPVGVPQYAFAPFTIQKSAPKTNNKGNVSRSQAAKLKAMLSGVQFPPLPRTATPIQRIPAQGLPRMDYLAAAKSRMELMPVTKDYTRMLLDPFDQSHGVRYPDEAILPTAMTHFYTSTTYVVRGVSTVYTGLDWKIQTPRLMTGSTSNASLPGQFPVETGGPIVPVDYGAQVLTYAGITPGSPAIAGSLTALAVSDRTLAYGVRVRVTGLPSGASVATTANGRFYFLQIQAIETARFNSTTPESYAIAAVQAGKGFTCTAQEVYLSPTGVSHVGLPQGPMSFLFSDTNSLPASTAGFTNVNPAALDSAMTATSSGILSGCPELVILYYGGALGTTIQFDYAHHVEYIPGLAASGLVDIRNQPPSAAARESIARVAQAVDQRISGATSLAEMGWLARGLVGVAKTALLTPEARMILNLTSKLGSQLISSSGAQGVPPWLTTGLEYLQD